MCGECGDLLTIRSAHLSDPCTVLCNEDGIREWPFDEVEIVALFFVGE
jgi:hypothetical protein